MNSVLEQRVYDLFRESVAAKMDAGDTLAPQIAHVSKVLVSALLDDKKLIICGNGVCGGLAQIFCAQLMSRLERDRPGLPAIALSSDCVTMGAIASSDSPTDVFSRQVRALGQAGDVLITISTEGNLDNLIQAIQIARGRGLIIVALYSNTNENFGELLQENDIALSVEGTSWTKTLEVHLTILSCLGFLIDEQLFGPMNIC